MPKAGRRNTKQWSGEEKPQSQAKKKEAKPAGQPKGNGPCTNKQSPARSQQRGEPGHQAEKRNVNLRPFYLEAGGLTSDTSNTPAVS